MNLSNLSFSSEKLAILYLARKAEGLAAFKQFVQSYNTHPAGIEHDLVIIFKGYENGEGIEEAAAVFRSMPHTPIFLPDEGFDLGSYLDTAGLLKHEYICCLNTFSQIRSDDWLKKLYAFACLPDTGIVGATGSYESPQDSIKLIQKAVWLNNHPFVDSFTRQQLNKYFEFIFRHTGSKVDPNNEKTKNKRVRNLISNLFKLSKQHISVILFGLKDFDDLEADFAKWWEETKTKGDIFNFCKFPPFPNPHIRSNAFMINRENFVALSRSPIVSKMDACALESGYEGMTRQILQTGHRAIIVGKNGEGYNIDRWAESETFRMQNQNNLLITDNQTRFFDSANSPTRFIHTLTSWGEDAISIPWDFPNTGIKFKVGNQINYGQ